MHKSLYFFYLIVFSFGIISCKTNQDLKPNEDEFSFGNSKALNSFDGKVVTDWNNMQILLTRSTTGYATPVAARSFAMVNLALYESTFYGMSDFKTLQGKVQGLENLPKPENGKEYNWALAANAAQYTILRELFSAASNTMKAQIDTLRRQTEVRLKVGLKDEEVDRSIRFGAAIANAIWEFSKSDGGHEAFKNNFPDTYVRRGGVATWKPTSSQIKPLLPQWGNVRSIFKKNIDSLPNPVNKFSFEKSTNYFLNAQEVFTTVKNLNTNQKDIIAFWQDDEKLFPHHLAVYNSIAKKQSLKMDEMVLLNLKIATGMHDASIACMKTKYQNDLMRPVTYIRQTIDPKWSNFSKDDSSPEFNSLSSSIAGVMEAILTNKLGASYTFTDETYAQSQGKRTFANLSAYAREASLASFYAGNHFKPSVESGIETGKRIARNILQLDLKQSNE